MLVVADDPQFHHQHHLMALDGASTMSKFQYLAHLTEIATEIAKAKKVPADEIFKTLASLPREKVAEQGHPPPILFCWFL